MPLLRADRDAADGVDDVHEAAEPDLDVVVDVDAGVLLDGPDQQLRAAEREGGVDLGGAVARDRHQRVAGDRQQQVGPAAGVQQHDRVGALPAPRRRCRAACAAPRRGPRGCRSRRAGTSCRAGRPAGHRSGTRRPCRPWSTRRTARRSGRPARPAARSARSATATASSSPARAGGAAAGRRWWSTYDAGRPGRRPRPPGAGPPAASGSAPGRPTAAAEEPRHRPAHGHRRASRTQARRHFPAGHLAYLSAPTGENRPAARCPSRTLAALSSVAVALPQLPSSALPSHALDNARDGHPHRSGHRRYRAGMLEPLTPAHSRVTLSLLAGPTHVNLLGNVHGGEIMRLADSTAGAVAAPAQRRPGGHRRDGRDGVPRSRCTWATSSAPSPRSTGPGGPRWRSASGSSPSRGTRPATSRCTSPRRTSSSWPSTHEGRPREVPPLAPETAERSAGCARPRSGGPTGSPRRPRSLGRPRRARPVGASDRV